MQLGLGASEAAPVRWLDDKRMVRPNQLESFVRWAQSSPAIVLDYEADGNKAYRGHRPFMAGLYEPTKGAKILEFRLLGEQGIKALGDAMRARTGLTIGHGLSYEVGMSSALGFTIGGTLWDNQGASFALRETRSSDDENGGHSQKALVRSELKRATPMADALRDWMATNVGGHKRGHELNPPDMEFHYNIEDVTDAWDLYAHFRPQVEANGQRKLVETDSELARSIAEIENRGLRLDLDRAGKLIDELSVMKANAYKSIVTLAGRHLDVASHKDLFGLLYGELGLPMHSDIEKYGKLDDDVLSWMETLEAVKGTKTATLIAQIGLWRECEKMLGTYLLPWVYEHQFNGRLFPNLNLTIARTRRFTANSPNLQNVPARNPLGRMVRSCIVADLGWRTWSLDYSQIEYRAFVHESMDPTLIRAYKSNRKLDVHQQVSDDLKVDRDTVGKHLNFGILFGMGSDKLARKTRTTKEVATGYLNRYHKTYPGAKGLKHRLESEIRARGYIRDVFGGRLHLEVKDAYKALNGVCQMTGADLIRDAMVRAFPMVKAAGGNVLLQVHDELKFQLPSDVPLAVVENIARRMEDYPQFVIPILCGVEFYDTNWQELQKVKR